VSPKALKGVIIGFRMVLSIFSRLNRLVSVEECDATVAPQNYCSWSQRDAVGITLKTLNYKQEILP